MVSLTAAFFLWLLFNEFYRPLRGAKEDNRFIIEEMETDCRRLMCGEKSRCIYRKNWCRSPPCPSMVFCSRGKKDLEMPVSCDKVRCSGSYRCSMRYVRDQRTGFYTNVNAECVAELKHQAASCAGFKCPRSHLACILREPKCRGFPCRILQACVPEPDAKKLGDQCSQLNCSSPDHCFLEKPYNCTINGCSHRAACLHSRGDKSLHDMCRGMLCPEGSECKPIYEDCSTAASLLQQSCKSRASCVRRF